MRTAVFISGRGSNLQALIESSRCGELRELCQIVVIVSSRSDAAGIDIARKANIPVLIQEKEPGQKRKDYDRKLLQALKRWNPEVIVLAGFNRILSPVIVGPYAGRILNIHPANPALFRGLDGYAHAFRNNWTSTQITVHLVDEGVDTGPVLGYTEIDLSDVTELAEVESRGLAAEHRLYSQVLARYLQSEAFQKIWKSQSSDEI